MVVDDESKDNSAEGVDFFYEWSEGKSGIDSNLCVIDEKISLSPVSAPLSIDDECSHVRATSAGLPGPQGEQSCIILDSGSDVSLLPMSFLADCTHTPKNHNLRDCQGQQFHTSGTKDTELVVNDLDDSQAIFETAVHCWRCDRLLIIIAWTTHETWLGNW